MKLENSLQEAQKKNAILAQVWTQRKPGTTASRPTFS